MKVKEEKESKGRPRDGCLSEEEIRGRSREDP